MSSVNPVASFEANVRLATLAKSCFGQRSVWRKRLWRFERNGADVDDILQEALLQAHLSFDKYRGEASVDTWFIAVVMNVARQHVAREVRRNAIIQSRDDESLPDLPSSTGIDSSSACPLHATSMKQLATDLAEALSKLPEELRKTFEITCIEERSYCEAAEELRVPIGTIRSRVNRARNTLRAALRYE